MMNTWRFPGNNFTTDEGLDTADMETFKKDHLASLARELCQNSIDAKIPGSSQPVKIVFKSFEIEKEQIPQRDLIEKQILACKETWLSNKKINAALTNMESCVKQDKIVCLRVSDFNTTGLIGVNTGEDNKPWHYLVHGSGLSDKSETSGGSKGIGKFATFVASNINTVFYSTKTITGEEGYEGICKLCSAKQPNTTEKTRGIGYFGSDDENKPIAGQLSLDKDFSREESGSDIYIIGFKKEEHWKRDIISKVLDSFITAIAFGNLEVVIDDIEINKESLQSIVYSDDLIKKELKKSIVSQYMLLTSPSRKEDVISVEGYGDVTLYLLEMNEELEEFATYNVVMIRYPYMKIKTTPKMSSIPCSAMCIIGDNNLNKALRDVENPQHTEWEFKRIEDVSKRDEMVNVYKSLLEDIRRIIGDHLATSDNTKTDLEGAGEYLPGVENEQTNKGDSQEKVISETPRSRKKTRSKTTNKNASVEEKEGDGVIVDISGDEDEVDSLHPEGHNDKKGKDPIPGEEGGKTNKGDDGKPFIARAELRGMQYRFICLNKQLGKYLISFISDFDEEKVSLTLYSLDEAGNKYDVLIKEAKVNNLEVDVDEQNFINFKISKGNRYKVEVVTNQDELFSGEVKLYAYR